MSWFGRATPPATGAGSMNNDDLQRAAVENADVTSRYSELLTNRYMM